MNISTINGTNFKGIIRVANTDKGLCNHISTDNITSINLTPNNKKTEIVYKPDTSIIDYKRIIVPYDINTVLNAYNATKNTDLRVDLCV